MVLTKNAPFLINARFLQEEHPTGVGRFGLEIVRRIHKKFPDVPLLAPFNIPEKWTKLFPLTQFGRLKGAAWEQIELPLFLRGEKRVLLNVANTCPLAYSHNATVIHDLIPLTHPQWYSRQARFYFRFMLPRVARRSLHLFTVSVATKLELQELLQVTDDRMTVASNCAGEEWSPDKNKPKYAEAYFLAVSSLDPRKNFRRLIEAFRKLNVPNLKLVIAGSAHKAFSEWLGDCDTSNVIFTGYLSDEELRNLYTHAEAFLFPSLKEGFGIPPLEAMRCGCPVITSALPVFREVCGDAALFIDPENVESIREGMLTMLQNRSMRAQLIEKGTKRAQFFSWEKSAEIISNKLIQYL